ncbi:MAG: hypothetical protein H7839_11185 [Magnetococcus sp. YQC-5]
MKSEISRDGKTIVVTIPMVVKKRGGRKLIIAPPGMEDVPLRDETLAKLVARAHKWLKMLESGKFPSIRALAEQEKIGESYMAKVLRLTFLAPDIIERILDGCQPDAMSWRELTKPFPMLWSEQRKKWGIEEPV